MINHRATDFDPALAIHPSEIDVDRSGSYRNGLKRALDVTLVLIAAPLVLPLVLIMAALVALDGANPFYSQLRLGKDGRVFRIWKLRSMVPNAEARLREYLADDPEARAEWNRAQKLKRDPRVTRVGWLLRKISLDELPQLLNVFTGSMSLVGPRPMMTGQRHLYFGKSYYRMRPGITGFWQISTRNESEFIARVQYDDKYDHSLSFWTDVKILVRTVAVVLRGTGY